MTTRIPRTIVICTSLYESACIQREKLHTEKVPNGLSPSWGTGEKQAEGELKSHLHESLGTTCLKYPETRYRSWGAAEGGTLCGKSISPQCTRSKLRSLQRACWNQTCLIPEIQSMCMPAACTKYKHCQSIRETRGAFMCIPVVNIHRSWTIIYHNSKRGSWWK